MSDDESKENTPPSSEPAPAEAAPPGVAAEAVANLEEKAGKLIDKLGEGLRKLNETLANEGALSRLVAKLPKASDAKPELSPEEQAEADKVQAETASIINLAIERIKRTKGKTLDVRQAFRTQLDAYLKAHDIKPTGEPPVVNIDADFIVAHGRELVPTLLSNFVQKLFASTESGETLEPASQEVPIESPEGAYTVKIDVPSIFSMILRPVATAMSAVSEKSAEPQAEPASAGEPQAEPAAATPTSAEPPAETT